MTDKNQPRFHVERAPYGPTVNFWFVADAKGNHIEGMFRDRDEANRRCAIRNTEGCPNA